MKIISESISTDELKEMAKNSFGNLVKVVVDVEREVMAVDGELHADLEKILLENSSQQKDLWGINIFPKIPGDDMIEFDSMINLRPMQNNMSRGVEDLNIRKKIINIVNNLIVR